jgi:MarR family
MCGERGRVQGMSLLLAAELAARRLRLKSLTSNIFLEKCYTYRMASWSFLTTHARVLLCIAHDPGARLRDIAARLGITERSAHSTVTDLAEAGYLIRQKDGRRNCYQIQAHLPPPGPGTRDPAVEQVLALFAAQGRLLTGPAHASDAAASSIRQPRTP